MLDMISLPFGDDERCGLCSSRHDLIGWKGLVLRRCNGLAQFPEVFKLSFERAGKCSTTKELWQGSGRERGACVSLEEGEVSWLRPDCLYHSV